MMDGLHSAQAWVWKPICRKMSSVCSTKFQDTAKPLNSLLDGTLQRAALTRLVGRGLVQVAGLTPSDALHVLGHHNVWNVEAATKALSLFGRQRDGSGQAFCPDPLKLADAILTRVQRRSAEVVLETAFPN